MGLVLWSGTISRAASPYWCKYVPQCHVRKCCTLMLSSLSLTYAVMESYELAGRHTFFSTVVSAGSALLLLLSLAALYRKLAPKSKWKGNDLSVNATSKLEDMEQDSLGESFEFFLVNGSGFRVQFCIA